MAARGLTNPQLEVNGLSVAIVPNSLTYTEGKGEQTVKAQSAGGASSESVFFNNAETLLSMLKFELFSTDKNIELARIWKTSANNNICTWSGGPNSDTQRAIKSAALTNNYEVELKNEGIISLEFHGEEVI